MKRSALSLALFYAAGGFALTGAILLAPPIQADNEVTFAKPKTSLSTKTFDLSIRYNIKSNASEVYVTNTTDEPQTAEWRVRVNSAGVVNPMSRVIPMQKEVSSTPVAAALAPHASRAVLIDVPAAQVNESRSVAIEFDGQTLYVPESVPHTSLSLNK